LLDIKELLVSKEVSVTSNLGAGIVPFNWQSFELHHLHLQDEEITKGMAYLFAEMGESYVDLIATGSSEALLIVEALAEVTSHPDDNISAITFNFWHHLSHALTNRCGLIWIHDFFPR
jgi:hypothetical protein